MQTDIKRTYRSPQNYNIQRIKVFNNDKGWQLQFKFLCPLLKY